MLQQEHGGGAGPGARTGFDSDVKPHEVLHCSLEEDLLGDILDKAMDSVAMRKEKEKHHHLADTVDIHRQSIWRNTLHSRKVTLSILLKLLFQESTFQK